MKALSLTQPWATLVVIGAKRIETRSWRTGYTGTLLIHATKALPPGWSFLFSKRAFLDVLDPLVGLNSLGAPNIDRLPRGALLGSVYLAGCFWTEEIVPPDEPERTFGDFSAGRYAWMLSNPVQWDEPISCQGRQRLFNVEVPGGVGRDGPSAADPVDARRAAATPQAPNDAA